MDAMKPLRIGVLAVQGNFREHAQMLRRLGADVVEVRKADQLDGLDGLVIPGGESTTFTRLMQPLRARRGHPRVRASGVRHVRRDDRARPQPSRASSTSRSGATRSAARWRRSRPICRSPGSTTPVRAVFIRAPWVEDVGPGVEVLAEIDGRPVLAREGRFLVAAFHPELTDDTRLHELFLESVREGRLSGHSKWSSIKHKKGAADAKRGQLFSKLSKAIIVAAKNGGGDPTNNLALQNAIEKAKSYSMPRDNIDRAIAKGSGADADADAFESITYEGYGPEGVAVIVEALTDNKNRTAADVRHLFAKHGGNLGTDGSVSWQFERRGVVVVPADGVDEEELFMAAADGGADDIEQDGTVFQITSAPEQFGSVRGAVEAAGFTVESAELMLVPKTTVAVDDEAKARQVMRLVDALEENDDVQDVYANFDIPEQVLELVAG